MKQNILAVLVGVISCAASSAGNFATEMLDATFKFFDPAVTGTCFFVHREAPDQALYLVTAAHMLEGTKAANATIVLRERLEDGTFKRHDHKFAIRRDGKPLWVRREKDDVAVLRLTDPLPLPVSSVSVNALADEARLAAAGVHICSPLFVLTYPKTFEANGAGFPVARQGIVASHPLMPIAKKHAFLADFTAFGGDSGGPVFIRDAEGHLLIIGMVFAQFRHDEKVKTEYEERAIHHPLGLGDVLHAQFVRDAIEQAAKQDDTPPK